MFPRFSSFFGILRGFGQACAGRMLGRGEWLAGVCPRQQGERVLRERGAAWLGVQWVEGENVCVLRWRGVFVCMVLRGDICQTLERCGQDNVVLHCAGQGNAQGYPSLV